MEMRHTSQNIIVRSTPYAPYSKWIGTFVGCSPLLPFLGIIHYVKDKTSKRPSGLRPHRYSSRGVVPYCLLCDLRSEQRDRKSVV